MNNPKPRRVKSLPRKMAALVPYSIESDEYEENIKEFMTKNGLTGDPAEYLPDWTTSTIARCYAA